MPRLIAVLVGITKYPVPKHRLRGCLNDVADMDAALMDFAARSRLDYPGGILLRNKRATRTNIISAFDNFSGATKEDVCFFYFSGHGSYNSASENFWQNSSGRDETLICYDSRLPGGRDLVDKEIGFICHRALSGSGARFYAVLDCCHAGSMFRSAKSSSWVKYREVQPAKQTIPASSYLGYAEYPRKEGFVSVPQYPGVALAACRSHQQSQERAINGAYRGVFTFCLASELKNAETTILLDELMRRIRLRTASINKEQQPYPDPFGSARTDVPFFPTTAPLDLGSASPETFNLYFQDNNWWVNGGRIHGISLATAERQAFFRSQLPQMLLFPVELEEKRCLVTIESAETLNPEEVYSVESVANRTGPLALELAPGIPARIISALEASIESAHFVTLLPVGAPYIVDYADGSIFLRGASEPAPIPIFERLRAEAKISEKNLRQFMVALKKVHNWLNAIAITNPNTKIDSDSFAVEIKTRKGALFPNKNQRETYLLPTDQNQSVDLKLQLHNYSENTLWFSILVLSEDFSISNQELGWQEIRPAASFSFKLKHWPALDTAHQFWGIDERRRYLKLFISNNSDLDLSSLPQSGLPLDNGQRSRGHSADTNVNRLALPKEPDDDWTIKNIELRIPIQLPSAKISNIRDGKLPGLRAKLRSDSFSAILRYASRNRYPFQWEKVMQFDLLGRKIQPIRELSAENQLSGELVFIEFSRFKDFNMVGPDAPITLVWNTNQLSNVEARLVMTNEVVGRTNVAGRMIINNLGVLETEEKIVLLFFTKMI